MTVLLDTNVLLRAALAPQELSRAASVILAGRDNTLLVSAASAWEIATKVRIGKLAGAVLFEADFVRAVSMAGYTILSITVEIALSSGRLAGKHGDPFDRMIAAQALALDVPVVSSDGKLDEFGVRRIW